MVMVIAEIGINHGGDEATAYKLIDAAVEAGADIAKFQLFQPVGSREHLKHLCLPLDAYIRLNEYCKAKGIGFACTAFDTEMLSWLLKFTTMEFVKISSGEHGNRELLEMAAESGLQVIQSMKNAVKTRFRYRDDWKTLHVVSEYPTIPENAEIFRVLFCDGLSDHSGEIFASLAAAAMGAKIIECHITLDKSQAGYDHSSSLNPAQFKEMVRGIRIIEKGLQ